MRRTASIYRHQRERAGRPLPYTLEVMRMWLEGSLAYNVCLLCGERATVRTFSVDHDIPLERGGIHDLPNLLYCHLACNQAKGNMALAEWRDLQDAIEYFPAEVRRSINARLRAGGARIYARKPK